MLVTPGSERVNTNAPSIRPHFHDLMVVVLTSSAVHETYIVSGRYTMINLQFSLNN